MPDTSKHPWEDAPRIPIQDCQKGRVYKLLSRNLQVGVYDGSEGFIGIRTKFGHRFLFTEYHWDQGPPHGTVAGVEDMGMRVPEEVPIKTNLGTVNKGTDRQVAWDQKRKWYYKDTGDSDDAIMPVGVANEALFKFLDGLGDDGMRDEYDFSNAKKYKVVKVQRGQKKDDRREGVPPEKGEVGTDS